MKIILGNAKLNILTSQANYELLIRMKTFENENGYARYSDFKVDDDASKFKMTLSKSSFTGNVGEQYLYKFSLSLFSCTNIGFFSIHIPSWYFN